MAKFMNRVGFEQGRSNPRVYYRPERDLRVTVHGDDFSSLGARKHLEWLHASMREEWEIVVRNVLGPPFGTRLRPRGRHPQPPDRLGRRGPSLGGGPAACRVGGRSLRRDRPQGDHSFGEGEAEFRG